MNQLKAINCDIYYHFLCLSPSLPGMFNFLLNCWFAVISLLNQGLHFKVYEGKTENKEHYDESLSGLCHLRPF